MQAAAQAEAQAMQAAAQAEAQAMQAAAQAEAQAMQAAARAEAQAMQAATQEAEEISIEDWEEVMETVRFAQLGKQQVHDQATLDIREWVADAEAAAFEAEVKAASLTVSEAKAMRTTIVEAEVAVAKAEAMDVETTAALMEQLGKKLERLKREKGTKMKSPDTGATEDEIEAQSLIFDKGRIEIA
jgi:predicted NUDIX family phosphoesterase